MDYQNQPQWNDLALHMPTSFDDDFLAMLQRQINAANPQQLLIDPSRFPAPPIEQPTPPLSEESSPGPSEDHNNSPVQATRSTRRTSAQMPLHDFTSSLLAHRDPQDDPHKRKAHDVDSEDGEDGQPTHKSQHRSNENGVTCCLITSPPVRVPLIPLNASCRRWVIQEGWWQPPEIRWSA
jgi:hypothetical protein